MFYKNIVIEKGKALKFFVLKMDKKFSVKNEALNREKTLEKVKGAVALKESSEVDF